MYTFQVYYLEIYYLEVYYLAQIDNIKMRHSHD